MEGDIKGVGWLALLFIVFVGGIRGDEGDDNGNFGLGDTNHTHLDHHHACMQMSVRLGR